jgi:hypothetical protein
MSKIERMVTNFAVISAVDPRLPPHPAPVAPLAGQGVARGGMRVGYTCYTLSALADRYSDAGARARSMDYLATKQKGCIEGCIKSLNNI